MRFVIAASAAALVAGLAFSADAAPAKKKQRYTANTERVQTDGRARNGGQEYGFENVPDHFRTGSADWWRAMDREGRGGCCGTP